MALSVQWSIQIHADAATYPKLSEFIKVLEAEDLHWRTAVTDFNNNPLHGLLGRGMKRKAVYVLLDQELRSIHHNRLNYEPLIYLRAIANRMANLNN